MDIDFYPAIKKYLLSFTKEIFAFLWIKRLAQTGRTLPDGTKSRKKTTHSLV